MNWEILFNTHSPAFWFFFWLFADVQPDESSHLNVLYTISMNDKNIPNHIDEESDKTDKKDIESEKKSLKNLSENWHNKRQTNPKKEHMKWKYRECNVEKYVLSKGKSCWTATTTTTKMVWNERKKRKVENRKETEKYITLLRSLRDSLNLYSNVNIIKNSPFSSLQRIIQFFCTTHIYIFPFTTNLHNSFFCLYPFFWKWQFFCCHSSCTFIY